MKPSPRSIQRIRGKVSPPSSERATATGHRSPGQAALPGEGTGVQVGLQAMAMRPDWSLMALMEELLLGSGVGAGTDQVSPLSVDSER